MSVVHVPDFQKYKMNIFCYTILINLLNINHVRFIE